MTKTVSFKELAEIVAKRGAKARSITAISGPPASGKSTITRQLFDALNNAVPDSAAILPLDGYHYDDLVLVPRGLRARKGAPHTFDVPGFAHMLQRIKQNAELEIAVPVFDRSIEIARAGAAMIPQSVRHILVEGNYLLLDDPVWASLRPLFDTSVMIDAEESVLRTRLMARWKDLSPDEALSKTEENDLPNARLVLTQSVAPEFLISD